MTALKEYIREAALLIEAIRRKRNADPAFDASFIDDFASALNMLENLESEQSTLRVKFKLKTAQVDERIDQISKYMSRAKKLLGA